MKNKILFFLSFLFLPFSSLFAKDFYIVQISDAEVICDISLRDGIPPNSEIEIFRNISFIHPVTKKKIFDTLFIGKGVIKEVRENLSTIEVKEEVRKKILVGDKVRITGFVSEREIKEGVSAPLISKEDYSFQQSFIKLLGKSIDEKIQELLSYLIKNPQTIYKSAIEKEVEIYKKLKEIEAIPPSISKKEEISILEKEEKEEKKPLILHNSPLVFLEGEVFEPVITAIPYNSIKKAEIYSRGSFQEDFSSSLMEEKTKGYFSKKLPVELTKGDSFEYFIMVEDIKGSNFPAVGSKDNPNYVAVQKKPKIFEEKKDRSTLNFNVEYINFFIDRLSWDYYTRFEGSFRYSLRKIPHFPAIKVGFGYFEGATGDTEEIKTDPDFKPDTLGFGYGFIEGELQFTNYVFLLPRLIIGTLDKKLKEEIIEEKEKGEKIFGFYTTLRIGNEFSTNLKVGGGGVMDAGWEAFINFNISILKNMLAGLGTTATNMPLDRNVGFRIFADVGYFYKGFGVSVRPSLNFRNIRHGGFGVGGALVFKW